MTYHPKSIADVVAETNERKKAVRQAARDVLSAVNGIALLGPENGVVWRGQADINWRLQSKAARQGMTASDITSHERAMLSEIRRIGADGAQYTGDWELLARLRHHGAATRLIDCTSDPFIALWFLCDDDSMRDDGTSVRDETGILLALQRDSFYQINNPQTVGSYSQLESRPVARLIYSTPPIDPRIAAQRGMFVLRSAPIDKSESTMSELGDFTKPASGNWMDDPDKAIADLCGHKIDVTARGRARSNFPEAIGIVVPPIVKRVLLKMLQVNFGFTRPSIYPDFSGVGQMYAAKVP